MQLKHLKLTQSFIFLIFFTSAFLCHYIFVIILTPQVIQYILAVNAYFVMISNTNRLKSFFWQMVDRFIYKQNNLKSDTIIRNIFLRVFLRGCAVNKKHILYKAVAKPSKISVDKTIYFCSQVPDIRNEAMQTSYSAILLTRKA